MVITNELNESDNSMFEDENPAIENNVVEFLEPNQIAPANSVASIWVTFPLTLTPDLFMAYAYTMRDSLTILELVDADQRKKNRELVRTMFSEYDNEPLLNRLTHFTLMVIFMDPGRSVAVAVRDQVAQAERLPPTTDAITRSRWLFEQTLHLVLGAEWIYGRCLIKYGPCPSAIMDAFTMEEPVGLQSDETDLDQKGLRGAEAFISIIGAVRWKFSDMQSVVEFLTELEREHISRYDIRAASIKILNSPFQ